jgi:hypothetical protein
LPIQKAGGFTDAGREFMKKTLVNSFKEDAFDILNPWYDFDSVSKTIKEINSLVKFEEQIERLRDLNQKVAARTPRSTNCSRSSRWIRRRQLGSSRNRLCIRIG